MARRKKATPSEFELRHSELINLVRASQLRRKLEEDVYEAMSEANTLRTQDSLTRVVRTIEDYRMAENELYALVRK